MTTEQLKTLIDRRTNGTLTDEERKVLRAELDRRYREDQDYVNLVVDR